ncbi:hypothetical protein JCM11641_008246 [Rhodosporidiobolus odoratus]
MSNQPNVYDALTARWTPLDPLELPDCPHALPSSSSSSSSSDMKPLRLNCLTYNTFSSSPTHTLSQSTALLSLLRHSTADIIALQEVSATFFSRLEEQDWVRQGYAITTPQGFWAVAGQGRRGPKSKDGEREACVLMMRKGMMGKGSEVGCFRMDRARDEQGKAAIYAKLFSEGDEQLRILTSHFTSLPENASTRLSQYRACLSFLTRPSTSSSSSRPPLLLLGDFNASAESELSLFPTSSLKLRDSFRPPRIPPGVKRSREEEIEERFRASPTFGHLYPWVSAGSRKPRRPRRIDRVYVAPGEGGGGGGGGSVEVVQYKQIGQAPLEGKGERDRLGKGGRRYASDHEGVWVEVEWGGTDSGRRAEEVGEEVEPPVLDPHLELFRFGRPFAARPHPFDSVRVRKISLTRVLLFFHLPSASSVPTSSTLYSSSPISTFALAFVTFVIVGRRGDYGSAEDEPAPLEATCLLQSRVRRASRLWGNLDHGRLR